MCSMIKIKIYTGAKAVSVVDADDDGQVERNAEKYNAHMCLYICSTIGKYVDNGGQVLRSFGGHTYDGYSVRHLIV